MANNDFTPEILVKWEASLLRKITEALSSQLSDLSLRQSRTEEQLSVLVALMHKETEKKKEPAAPRKRAAPKGSGMTITATSGQAPAAATAAPAPVAAATTKPKVAANILQYFVQKYVSVPDFRAKFAAEAQLADVKAKAVSGQTGQASVNREGAAIFAIVKTTREAEIAILRKEYELLKAGGAPAPSPLAASVAAGSEEVAQSAVKVKRAANRTRAPKAPAATKAPPKAALKAPAAEPEILTPEDPDADFGEDGLNDGEGDEVEEGAEFGDD